MTRTIIVPLDGSPLAEDALRVAYSAAERAGVAVTAIRVRESHDDSSDYLETATQRFVDTAPTKTLTLDGPPADRILEASEDADATICVATHGRSGIRRLVLGSVAEEIVRRSHRPVIVVGPNGAGTPLRSERASMVVCTDGSAAAAAVLPAAASFARDLNLTCSVIQVVGPDEDVSLHGEPPLQPIREQAQRQCADYCQQLSAEGVSAHPVVLHGDPERTIVQYARLHHASLIAVATHGNSGLTRATLGSTTSSIVRHAPCPVLVVRIETEQSP